MERYRNTGRNFGIRAYEIGEDFIIVQFVDGGTYLYNNSSTGSSNVEKMKVLAMRGQGLNSFISVTIRKSYASKLR